MSKVVGDIAIDVSADIGPLVRDMGKGTAAVSKFGQTSENVRRGLGRLDDTTRRYRSGVSAATRDTGSFGRGVQNAAFQIGDFAVQVGGGTSAMRAMSMQLPQLLGGFGVLGAVAGAAVAIIGPLAQALFRAGESAEDAAKEFDGVSSALGSMRGQISGLSALQEKLNELHRAQAGASAAGASAVIANTQKEFNARKQLLEVERTLLRLRSQDAVQALNALESQQEAARAAIKERLRTIGPGATDSRGAGSGGFAGVGVSMGDITNAIGEESLKQLRSRATEIEKLKAELALVEIAADEATAALDGVFNAPGDIVGGGRGGGSGVPRVEALKEQLSAHEQAIADHLARVKALTEGGLWDQLGAWRDYFQNLGQAMGEGGEKALRVAKAFGAAQALVSAYQGAAEALKLPFPANLAAYAQVLATGIGAVNAIKNVSKGGGGGAGGASTAPAAVSPVNTSPRVAITLTGGDLFTRDQVRGLINAINEEVEGGAIVRLA